MRLAKYRLWFQENVFHFNTNGDYQNAVLAAGFPSCKILEIQKAQIYRIPQSLNRAHLLPWLMHLHYNCDIITRRTKTALKIHLIPWLKLKMLFISNAVNGIPGMSGKAGFRGSSLARTDSNLSCDTYKEDIWKGDVGCFASGATYHSAESYCS